MRSKLLLFLIFAALAFSACQSTSPTAPANSVNQLAKNIMDPALNTANTAQPGLSANNAQNAVNTAVPVDANAEQPTAPAPETPASTIKALADAGNKRDIAALRQLFSRRSLEMFGGQAKEQGKTVEEILVNQRTTSVAKINPELRNQKIEGSNASIEVRGSKSGRWETFYFVLEDGRWKIAMDKYMEAMIREIEESTRDLETK